MSGNLENKDCKKAKDQWRELVLGILDENAEHSEEYTEKVKKVSAVCKATYENYLNSGPSFGKIVENGNQYANGDGCNQGGSNVQLIYDNIFKLAKGYGTVGSDFYHSREIAQAIENLLEYAHDNYYSARDGEVYSPTYKWSQKEGTTNWWYRDIGIPLSLVPTLIVMEDYLGAERVKKYISPFDCLNPIPHMTMANRLWIGRSVIGSALLQEDEERLTKAKAEIMKIFEYVDKSDRTMLRGDAATDGFYSDGSFIQHGKTAYTGGYGLALIDMFADIMMVFNGTSFNFNEDDVKLHYELVFDTYMPISYKGKIFSSLVGRNVTRPGVGIGNTALVVSMIKISSYAPAEYKSRLQSAIRHNMKVSDNDYEYGVPLCLLEYTKNLRNDESIVPVGVEGARVFGCMDRVIQHGEKYGVCVALNSTRTYKFESLGDDNNFGWYLTDGSVFIHTDGYSYTKDFFKQSRAGHKIAGTTVLDVQREPVYSEPRLKGGSPFAGGVESADKKYAVSVYELGFGDSDNVRINEAGYYKPELTAYKSYFLFDNEIVALGSNISKKADSYGDCDIYTTVDNRIWREGDKLTANGRELNVTGPSSVTARNLHFTNMGGYVFFEDTDVKIDRNDTENASFLELWINHGVNGADSNKYAYVYLPASTLEETKAYSSNPEVEILTQTDKIHVVRENKLGVTGYAFYEKGEANGVKVSDRCTVMVSESNGAYAVTVSDPTHLLEELEVEIKLPVSEVVSKCENAKIKFEGEKAVILLDIKGNIGQTYSVTIK